MPSSLNKYKRISQDLKIENNQLKELWMKIYNFLNNYDFRDLLKNTIKNENKFNEELCKILKQNFQNVQIHKKYTRLC